jgi:prepilin-type N-terminal cleavage/methylation domain-containing protein
MYARRDDGGFTLIELLISIVLLGIIIVSSTVAPVLGANLGCGQPACVSITPDINNPTKPRVFTLTATTPNNENYFTLTGTRRAT